MRFTRYTATLLFVFCVGGIVITGMLYFDAVPFPADSLLVQTVYTFLLLFPFIVTPIGAVLVYSSRHAFLFSPRKSYSVEEYQSGDRSLMNKEDDALIHVATGCMVALLQDFSMGRILNREIYAPAFVQEFEQELHFLQVYLDRGFRFHFAFHHEQTHHAFIRYRVNDYDVVIELQGLFDYYFEHNGNMHPTPHDYDVNPPLLNTTAFMRIRLEFHPSLQRWIVVGFSESIRGLRMGLATE